MASLTRWTLSLSELRELVMDRVQNTVYVTTQRIGLDFPTRNMEFSISYRKGFSRLRYEVTVNENMKSFPVQGDEQVSQKP